MTKKSRVPLNLQPISPRNTLLHEQEMMMEAQFRKVDIRDYLLFIHREGRYQLASWRGLDAIQVESLTFEKDSLIVDLLKSQPQHQTLQTVQSYFEDDIFLPSEFQSQLGSELRLFQHLGVTDFFPLVDSHSGLFGFVLTCTKGSKKSETSWSEALKPHLFSWGRHYYDLYVGYESKYERTRMSDYISFIHELGEETDDARNPDHILRYILKAHGATKGILFERRSMGYKPIRAFHVEYLQTYDRKILDGIKKQGDFDVRDTQDPFFQEFGPGPVNIFALTDKLTIVMKTVFHQQISPEILSSVLSISKKILECHSVNKSK